MAERIQAQRSTQPRSAATSGESSTPVIAVYSAKGGTGHGVKLLDHFISENYEQSRMAEIRFYHLQSQSIEQALPKLAELVLKSGNKGVIKIADKNIAKKIDKALWTYSPESFLPHDVEGSNYPEEQSLYITTQDENPASAKMALFVNCEKMEDLSSFDRVLYMFEGRLDEIITAAREDYKNYKNAGHEMSYWQQSDQGRWEQKA